MIAESFFNAPEYALIGRVLYLSWARVMALFQMAANQKNTLMYLWLLSHATCLLGFLTSSVIPSAYGAAVIGCNVTYAMAVHRHFRYILRDDRGSSLKLRAPISDLLHGENTVLLASALLVANTEPSLTKLLPFATYATMNLMSFLILDVLPTSAFTKTSMPFLRYLETTALSYVCYWDYVVMLAYGYEWLFKQQQACWLVFYMVTWLVKLEISELSRKSLHGLVLGCTRLMKALGFNFIVPSIEEFQASLSVVLPTKESPFPGDIPDLALSSKDRVESLMFDSFSIINDVDR